MRTALVEICEEAKISTNAVYCMFKFLSRVLLGNIDHDLHGSRRRLCRVLAFQSIPSWNRIISWLKEMETLRQMPP